MNRQTLQFNGYILLKTDYRYFPLQVPPKNNISLQMKNNYGQKSLFDVP